MQTELVNQIEVKLRKIYQAAYQPAYLKKCSHALKTILIIRVVRLILFPKKTSILLLMVTAFSKKQASVTNIK